MSSRESRISEILSTALAPRHLEIEDESHQHSGPRSETHFKVLIVSEKFEGKSRIDRQRMVNELLAGELKMGLHALTQRTLTPGEWDEQREKLRFESPACLGGSLVGKKS